MASLRIRGKEHRIYIQFRLQQRQMQEPTKYICEHEGKKNCKCRSCKAASALALEIDRKIRERTFNLKEYFPESRAINVLYKKEEIEEARDILFKDYCAKWLYLKEPRISKSTHRTYKDRINSCLRLLDDNITYRSVTEEAIDNAIRMMYNKGYASKTIKEHLVLMSSISRRAIKDKIITVNPLADIERPKNIRKKPDPFTAAEINAILSEMTKRAPHPFSRTASISGCAAMKLSKSRR